MKIPFLVLCLFTISLSAPAQESYVGIKGGYVLAALKGDNEGTVSLRPRHSFTAGLVISSAFETLPLGLSVEPGYVRKGSRTDVDTLDYKFHYLNIPVLLDFYPIEKLKLSAGIEPAFLAAATNRVDDNSDYSLLDTYNNRWEASWIMGASCSPAFFMDLGVRFSRAFTKAADQDAVINHRDLYNQYWQVFVVFKIAN